MFFVNWLQNYDFFIKVILAFVAQDCRFVSITLSTKIICPSKQHKPTDNRSDEPRPAR